MPRYDFTTKRLFVSDNLHKGAVVALDKGAANYLINVLRLGAGAPVLLFNGRDGEWLAHLAQEGRKKASLTVEAQMRAQTERPDLHLLFAPLKQARMEYMVQKAVEMGVGRIVPVSTRYTQAKAVRPDKMAAYVTEAAEQCGILAIPSIGAMVTLKDAVCDDRHVIFCDEGHGSQNPLPILQKLPRGPLALLIGPEGGFDEEEREWLNGKDNVTAIPLGPRVLRADTAAVAALAVVQAVIGDWR